MCINIAQPHVQGCTASVSERNRLIRFKQVFGANTRLLARSCIWQSSGTVGKGSDDIYRISTQGCGVAMAKLISSFSQADVPISELSHEIILINNMKVPWFGLHTCYNVKHHLFFNIQQFVISLFEQFKNSYILVVNS